MNFEIPTVMAVQLGRTGDILNIIPALRLLNIHKIMVHHDYLSTLSGFSGFTVYEYWGDIEDLDGAVKYAEGLAKIVRVPQLFGLKQPTDNSPRMRPSFVQDQWDRLLPGLGDKWGTLPLVVNTRNSTREKDLLLHVVGNPSLPILLVNTAGLSGAYPNAGDLLRYLRTKTRHRFTLVDLAYVRPQSICDLLALYDCAAGLVTIDTATLHLARACPRLPVFQFVRPGPDGVPPIYPNWMPYEWTNFGAVGEWIDHLEVRP